MLYFEDISVGHRFDLGSKLVRRDEIIKFAREFDPQPFHLDDEAGRRSVFGGLCASGWHTAAMLHRLTCDSLFGKIAGLGSPGMDELKWKKPVFPDDTLSASCTVLDKRVSSTRKDLGLVNIASDVRNQKGEQVMSLRGWLMIARKA